MPRLQSGRSKFKVEDIKLSTQVKPLTGLEVFLFSTITMGQLVQLTILHLCHDSFHGPCILSKSFVICKHNKL